MKFLPGLFLLLLVWLSPSLVWAADDSAAGANNEADAEQPYTDGNDKKENKDKKKSGKKKAGAAGDEEPECE